MDQIIEDRTLLWSLVERNDWQVQNVDYSAPGNIATSVRMPGAHDGEPAGTSLGAGLALEM